MPLVFSDGTEITFTSSNPMEVNCCYICNIRADSNGLRFVNSPGTFNPSNRTHRLTSYGIGAGIGRGFILKNFLSELNGGVGLYVYSGRYSVRRIKDGYMEVNCRNSGLDPETELLNMFIENTDAKARGRGLVISDIFMHGSSGGIGIIGTSRKVKLKNIYQPKFIKDFGGGTASRDMELDFPLTDVDWEVTLE